MYAPSFSSMLDRPALPRIVPFAIYMAFVAIADLLTRLGWSAAELRWLYAVKIAAVIAALLYYRRRYIELTDRRLRIPELAMSASAGVVVLALWVNLDASWMSIGSAAGFDPRTDGRMDWLLVAVRLAGAALVVPVMEELFWRSFLMRWMASTDFLQADPRQVRWGGFVVVATLFAVEHNLWLAGLAAGAAYGLLYAYTRNLWTAVLAHAVTNGLLGCWIIVTAQWTYW